MSTQAFSTQTQFDSITFSVMMKRLESIVREMSQVLEKSAWSSIISLCHDFSCTLHDRLGRQLCVYDSIPMLTTSVNLVVEDVIATFGSSIAEGDVYLSNHPYRGNTHVGDLVVLEPVFADGEVRFWSVNKAHHLDVGAFVPASCTPAAADVYQEGLHIPPTRIVAGGTRCEDVLELVLANVRFRESIEGDLLAQIGACGRGVARLHEFCREFGVASAVAYGDAVIEYADRRMGRAIAAIPDGRYHGEGWVDSDGRTDRVNIPIKVTVTVEGEQVEVDFTGSAEQVVGGLNGSRATTMTSGIVPFLYLVDPTVPHNQGAFDHVTVVAPEGTITNPTFPASTSCATVVPSSMLHDAVMKAMAAAVPELVAAGTARCSNVPQFTGKHPETGEEWGVMVFNNSGGGGAVREADGWPLMESPSAMGGQKTLPIEQLELLHPLRVEEMQIEPESMGFGACNGGAGVRMAVRPLGGPMECISFGDGCENPPHGACGGTPALGGGQYVESTTTGTRRFVSAAGHFEIAADEVWVGVSTGGGGYGDPLARSITRVAADVRDGLLGGDTARSVFGVVVDQQGVVDEAATARAREELASRSLPMITPEGPGAAKWVAVQRRPEDEFLLNPRIDA